MDTATVDSILPLITGGSETTGTVLTLAVSSAAVSTPWKSKAPTDAQWIFGELQTDATTEHG